MSTYCRFTRHPVSKQYEPAVWLDDYFGSHHYGVRFGGENTVFDDREYDIKTREPKDEKERELLCNLFKKILEI